MTRILSATALAVLLSGVPAYAQWAAPIGIPNPSFGVNEVARAVPSPWTTATAGFYYVDATHGASTDTSNPYGTPGRPRKTIPDVLPAGAVVELHGTYDHAHSSPHTIVANGTAAQPVFVRGASASAKPVIRAPWELMGSYVILENLEFAPYDSSESGELVMLAPLHHAALRHSDLHGNLTEGGLGIVSWSGSTIDNVVIYDNSIHDNGDLQATYDQDVHGIVIGVRVSNTWIVDNRLYRNSGDGIQINAGSLAAQTLTHHIYVGRNTAYNNKQTGFWSKQAVDVIFSQNLCYGHRPSNSSMGVCMGYQYATERAWFLYNIVTDSEFGIGVMSDSDLGIGTESAFVGNIIFNIHHSTGYNPSSAWSTAAIMLAGGDNVRVVNNTIYNVDAGVNVTQGALASLEISGNIIGQVTVASAWHVFLEDAGLASRLSMHHNLFEGSPRANLGGTRVNFTATQLSAMYSLSASPKFLDAATGDFRLQSSSPAIDRGEAMNPVYSSFQQRYGVSIAKDPFGAVKPTGPAMDLGAFEFAGCGLAICPVTAVAMTPMTVSSPVGTPLTFIAGAAGGVNPIQYRFWHYSASSGWSIVQDYSANQIYTWTPTYGDIGTHIIQVWAKSPGSVNDWEAWKGTEQVTITSPPPARLISLTPSSLGSVAAGTSVTWQATSTGGLGPTQYKFWRYRASDRTWSVLRDYSTSNTVTWMPLANDAGSYAIQVWARSSGSPADLESFLNTDNFSVVSVAPKIMSFTPKTGFISRVGTQIRWTADVAAAGAAVQYKFWRYKATPSGWTMVQNYSSSPSYTWTPTSGETGTYRLQVWVRRTTSTADWEDWAGTDSFVIIN